MCALQKKSVVRFSAASSSSFLLFSFILTHTLSLSQMKQQQKTLSEFNKIPLISSSKGKEETQKEAKNAFAAPFKRKNFSSEEGDRERKRKRRREAKEAKRETRTARMRIRTRRRREQRPRREKEQR